MSDDTSHYYGVLLEEIRDDVKALTEALSGLINKANKIDTRLARTEENTVVLPAFKAAIINHESRITGLEEVVL